MIPQYTQNKSKGYIVESGSNSNYRDTTDFCNAN